jgi:hypothetical protein
VNVNGTNRVVVEPGGVGASPSAIWWAPERTHRHSRGAARRPPGNMAAAQAQLPNVRAPEVDGATCASLGTHSEVGVTPWRDDQASPNVKMGEV